MKTIEFTDGRVEEYPRVRLDDGFAVCYEKTATALERSDFKSRIRFWLTFLLWVSLTAYQSRYYEEKVVPESQIEEIK
jgi:hypothetical protein